MNTLYDKEFLSDDVIIQKVLHGETTLFAELIRKYNPVLYKIARAYCSSHEDAEDMIQESHFSAYLQLKTFRGDSSYKTWITKILINNCYHYLQYRQKKFRDINIDLLQDRTKDIQYANDGEKTMTNIELGRLLERSLKELPLIYRTVFVLRKIEGLTVAETAEILQITQENVKVRLNRARILLRKQLQSFYSIADIYDFNLNQCKPIIERVAAKISN